LAGAVCVSLVAEIVQSFSELERLEEAWDRLAMARPNPEVFHTFAWARAWFKGYGPGCDVFSPVVRDASGQVVAIWPLVRRNSKIVALGDGASDHNDLLSTVENARPALEAALHLLAENGRTWSTGVITNVSQRGFLLDAARGIAAASKTRMEIVRGGTGWAAVADQGPSHFLPLARKESLRRHRKKLEKIGPVTFRHIEDREEIKTHLRTFQRQHIERWALRGIKSNFLDSANTTYFSALPDCLSALRPLRFSVLEVGGLPVAYHLGFEIAGRYIWYKPTFDVDLSDLGPGEVLLQSVLQYCASNEIRELDFTIGEESYKSRFSNLTYDYFQIHLFSRLSARQYALRARERLKSRHPGLYSSLKARLSPGGDWLRRLRQALQRDGVARFAAKRLRQLIRAFAFQRDEVIVFRHSGPAVRPPGAVPVLEIVPLRFSLLADTALRYPETLGPDDLEMFHARIAGGDRGVVALYRGGVAHVAWVGKRSAIVAGTETGPHCSLPLPQEASVIYGCWTPDEFRGLGVYPAVLQSLVQAEKEAGRDVWIYCLRQNLASRAGILKAGFAEQARLLRIRWFRRLERCRVTPS
jgi:CelD/BcsL family acetyltransferase involved in cellulose biosynthesis